MTRNMSFLRVFVLLLFFANFSEAEEMVANSPEALGLSSQRLQRLDRALESYVDNKQLAGGVVLIARHGKMAHTHAFGWRDKESNSQMTDDVMFRIASQTKALTSVAIMILQEQGALLISDPVSKYLPEFEQTTVAEVNDAGDYAVVPAHRPITIRDLLTHSAGIDYGFGPAESQWKKAGLQGWYFAHRDEPLRDTVARIASLPQKAHPGEAFVYGYNTDILGAVIEVASGKALDQYLYDSIFQPLGMGDTHFYMPEDKKDRLATVYTRKSKGIERAATPGGFVGGLYIGQGHFLKGPRKSFSGGAGLISTAKDYGRFLQMLLNGGELEGKRVLSRKSVELMTVNHLTGRDLTALGPGVGFGLGFLTIDDLGEYGELGSKGTYAGAGAYHSSYWVDPEEDLLVVYLTQLIPAGNIDDVKKLRALVYQALID